MGHSMTLNTEGHAITQNKAVRWMRRKREFVVGMKFTSVLATFLAGIVVAGENTISPVDCLETVPNSGISRCDSAAPMPMVRSALTRVWLTGVPRLSTELDAANRTILSPGLRWLRAEDISALRAGLGGCIGVKVPRTAIPLSFSAALPGACLSTLKCRRLHREYILADDALFGKPHKVMRFHAGFESTRTHGSGITAGGTTGQWRFL